MKISKKLWIIFDRLGDCSITNVDIIEGAIWLIVGACGIMYLLMYLDVM